MFLDDDIIDSVVLLSNAGPLPLDTALRALVALVASKTYLSSDAI